MGTKMKSLLEMSTSCDQRMHREVERGVGGRASAVQRLLERDFDCLLHENVYAQ